MKWEGHWEWPERGPGKYVYGIKDWMLLAFLYGSMIAFIVALWFLDRIRFNL